jgi:D-beta-D-heptose 7-phosphate kinase/D-beta-D-heptose 1-phosphate adenosyltransferase
MKKIVVIGDFATDRTVFVRPTRLCPEAPVPVVVPIREVTTMGMAGNVTVNLISMSGDNQIVYPFGPQGIKHTKLRYVDEATGYIMLRVDTDVETKPFDAKALFDLLEAALPKVDAIVMSDYAKGFLNQENVQRIATYARAEDIPTFLDTKMILGDWSKDVFCVKINQKEYKTNLDANLPLFPRMYCQHLVVTKAGNGAELMNPNGETMAIQTTDVQVADVCGAGDTMLAGLVLKYVSDPILSYAVEFANKVASFAVTKHGVYAVTQQDIKDLGLSLKL